MPTQKSYGYQLPACLYLLSLHDYCTVTMIIIVERRRLRDFNNTVTKCYMFYIHGCHPTCLCSQRILLILMETWRSMPVLFNLPSVARIVLMIAEHEWILLEMLEKLFAIYFTSTNYRWNLEIKARVCILTSFIQSSQWTPYTSE